MSENDRSILIYYSKFNIGGAERSNLRLMNYLVSKGWKVTLMLRYGKGTLESAVSDSVSVIHLSEQCYTGIISAEKNRYKKAFLVLQFLVPILIDRIRRVIKLNKMQKEDFDIAMLYLLPAAGFELSSC